MSNPTLPIGLAAARNAPTIGERLEIVERFLAEASEKNVAIVCFPETYIPGLRGQDFEVPPPDQCRQEAALERVRRAAEKHRVAVILPMEWEAPPSGDGSLPQVGGESERGRWRGAPEGATELGLHNIAFVISKDGVVEGYQTKNQIPLEEAPYYVPDGKRRLFEVDGVPFGITICHEGWRYPEATRWAAVRGAKVVFHPHLTGSDKTGPTLTRWGDPDSPYYEKAMLMRSIENTIYFASVNNAFRFQESATSLIGPDGDLLAYVPYGEEQLLVYDLDLSLATGLIAKRFNPELYPGQ